MKPEIDYTLYLVTDSGLMSTATVEESVELAIAGGVSLVQLREKEASSRAFYEAALRVKAVTQTHGIPLIINDRLDIAQAVDAEGVHIGQDDLPIAVARGILGPDKVIGVSAGNLAQAQAAVQAGADYLGIGAMYATGTKTDAVPIGLEDLHRIRAAVSIPIVVIGGINKNTIPGFYHTGIDGLAVVSAIVAQPDITAAARDLKALFLRGGIEG